MPIKFRLLNTLSFCGLLLLLASCRKSNNFNYEDGTPGDGDGVPNITIDTNVKHIDVSKYAQARVFPGLVCNTEPRLNNVQVSMDLNYNFVGEDLRINVPPQPQFSTGLYGAPGELVVIDVPQNSYSLSVQIGAWTDNLSNVLNAPRDPIIFTKTQLAPGRNYIRNLYGGHIYIYAGRPVPTPVTLTFSNVVKSPDFVLGKTTNAEWKDAIAKSCVPYLELRSRNIIFVVPREYCITYPINDPTAAMQEWDKIIEKDFYEWEGLSENPIEEIDKAPLLPWRIVQDIKPAFGYGHSGYPIVVQNDYSWFSGIGNVALINGGGNWGFFHEIGHNNQQPRYWSWSKLTEVTCNLFAFKVANRLQAQTPAAWPPKHPSLATSIPNALSFAADAATTKNFDGSDARIDNDFARLAPFVQIFDKVPAGATYDSWGFMAALYKKARRANRISINDQDKRDFFYETLCEYTGLDWRLFFQKWGIAVSNISLNKMTALPLMLQEIWKYNPLTRTGGDTQADPKQVWTMTGNSWATNEGTNGFVERAFDGLTTTYWHSSYGTGTGPTSPNANTGNSPGFHITVDMVKPTDIKGFRIALRQSGAGVATVVRNVKVEVSNDNNTWSLASFQTASPRGAGFVTLAEVQGLQSFNLTATQTARYFRVSIPTNADNKNNGTSSALSEIDIIR